jgi:hypothetical protein
MAALAKRGRIPPFSFHPVLLNSSKAESDETPL